MFGLLARIIQLQTSSVKEVSATVYLSLEILVQEFVSAEGVPTVASLSLG